MVEQEDRRIDDHERNKQYDWKVNIFVNEKPVFLEDEKQTGLSIKKAAIEQDVGIQIDFVLSIERDGGKTELIGDKQHIAVNQDERFLAIPNDDNS